LISQTPTVGLTAGNYVNMAYFANTRGASNDGLRIVNVRDSTGSGVGNWETESFRIRRSIDQSDASSGVQEEIVFGNNLLAFNTAGTERARISSTGGFSVGTTTDPGAGKISDNIGDVRTVPINSQTAGYTLVAADSGKHVSITTGGVTVPSGVFSAGQMITIYNNSASNQTITQGASVTMYIAGTATTGNRTLAQRGLVTLFCVASNTFVINGGGLS